MNNLVKILCFVVVSCFLGCKNNKKDSGISSVSLDNRPNVILIYADDLGYGDLSCYGMTNTTTPNIDELASQGILFTNAHATSATCTPSRYSLLTGTYAWRHEGTGIASGNAGLIINPKKVTIADIFQQSGYKTAVVGKWHLGLGPKEGPDWNNKITPGPEDLGFGYSFLIPATGDRVPCVYTENGRVVNLDPDDPIQVSYGKPVGNEPTGKDNPELLKMKFHHGHDKTIVNGISRIGYMSGGKKARWVDEDMADVITGKAIDFIRTNKDHPFFLYFSTHDIHVPRVPHSRFIGKSGMGPRGDAILQLDWCTGQITETLEQLNLTDKTLVIFTSDNGPVLNDGYFDDAVEKLNGHKPAGPLRGGKYSSFNAGTRVPFIVRWPGTIEISESSALFSQVDLFSSLSVLLGHKLNEENYDSKNHLHALTGKDPLGRDYLVGQSASSVLSIIRNNWKYIEPSGGPLINKNVNIELGNDTLPQLYNLAEDIAEQNNLASQYPDKVDELKELLLQVKKGL